MEMIFLNTIKTIDLWTEQNENHIECFSGAFVDGFENGDIPFDTYKVIRNGNCIIISNRNDLNISNKHNAIVFYKNGVPTRLMVINQNTDIDNCIDIPKENSGIPVKLSTFDEYLGKLQLRFLNKGFDFKEISLFFFIYLYVTVTGFRAVGLNSQGK